MRRFSIIISLLIACNVLATDFYWDGGTADWLVPANWGGTAPSATGDVGHVASGVVQVSAAPSNSFPSVLSLETGGTLSLLQRYTTNSTLRLAGGTITWDTAALSTREVYTTNGLVAVAGTTTIITDTGVGTRPCVIYDVLTGTGNILVTNANSAYVSFANAGLYSDFGGTITVANSECRLPATTVFGAGGALSVCCGGLIPKSDGSATWTMPGGFILNGGKFYNLGNNVLTFDNKTPFKVTRDSVIELDSTATTPRTTKIDGVFSGTGGLTLTNDQYFSLQINGMSNTYSGTITINNGSCLIVTNSGGLSLVAPYAGIVIDSGLTNGMLVVTNGSDIIVKSLRLGITNVADGTYSQSNPLPLANFVTFPDAGASLQIISETVATGRIHIIPQYTNMMYRKNELY